MLQELWRSSHSSVCSIAFMASGQPVGVGTGFLAGGKLITNNHVIRTPGASDVLVQFVQEDGHSPAASVRFAAGEFAVKLMEGDPEAGWDFAILDIGAREFPGRPDLELADNPTLAIGRPIAFLGYHFGQSNLAIGAGIIASRFSKAGVKYLQLDASVNQGNSGGPLLDPSTKQVVGIITRKATGLTEQFGQLMVSFDTNLRALSQSQAVIRVGGVDPIEMSAVAQHQMKAVAQEIQRSANVGIGFAYELDKIRPALRRCTERR